MLNIAMMIGYLAWSSKRVSYLISTHPSTMIDIIIQIQGSITSKEIENFGGYEEMQCEENKVYTRQNIISPSNQVIGMTNSKSPSPQSSKSRSIKGFGEIVSQLSLCVCISSLCLLSQHGLSGTAISLLCVWLSHGK
jgi:hypothetical protein